MENVMINSYVQVTSTGQRLKEKFVQALNKSEDEYNGPITWATVALAALALLALIVIVAAAIWCTNRGFRGGAQVDGSRGNIWHVGVGCRR